MKRLLIILILLNVSNDYGYGAHLHLIDSVGVTQKGSDEYIIHQVDAGETLFGLSRKYNVSVQNIRDANEISLSSLNIGQKVLIPIIENGIEKNSSVHVVKSSETLFSISRQYNVKVDELKAWNNLSDNSISIGQELIIKYGDNEFDNVKEPVTVKTSNRKIHIVEESQTLYSISRMYDVSTEEIKDWNNLNSNNLSIGQELIVSADIPSNPTVENHSSMLPPSADPSNKTQVENNNEPGKKAKTENTVATSATAANIELEKVQTPVEKVVERGIAEVFKDSEETKKYLALHRSAPVGTIMQVKNEMNDQTVFVRVVGPIPPTGDNEKLLLMISKKAYDRLGVVDSRFPVEVSYIP